jgi:hypothetical protein
MVGRLDVLTAAMRVALLGQTTAAGPFPFFEAFLI